MEQSILVGDIGGTNVRLALSERDTGSLREIRTYLCCDHVSPAMVIQTYFDEIGQRVQEGCIAIACPVQGDSVSMTNHIWEFSIEQTRQELGLKTLCFINDYTALSMAVPVLAEDEKFQIGNEAKPQANAPIAIYGPGTGLGVAHLVHTGSQWLSLPGEGGHCDFAPHDELLDRLLERLRERFGHVSYERLLSGPGLVNIHEALCQIEGITANALDPAQITERGLNNSCPQCRQTLEVFCCVLGSFGGNLALNMGTFGGVYIAGGIVPRLLDFVKTSAFREFFDNKGRFESYLSRIPTYVITASQPGLLGASAWLRQRLGDNISPE